MKLGIIGDVMLGRFVREHHKKAPYYLLSPDVEETVHGFDFCIGNLESPITDAEERDSLKFSGNSNLLDCFRWINCFSLSNNHINDFGEDGMIDTINALTQNHFEYNGLYEDKYRPLIIRKDNNKLAVVTCTDMLNKEFDEQCRYHTLRATSQQMNEVISEYQKDHFVIVYAHIGHLFSRFPNPQVRDIIYSWIDAGAGCIVTVHSHCLGGGVFL